MPRRLPPLALLALLLSAAPPAGATWSIVLADSRTGEVAVGSVTCLTRFDLRALTPVVLVGRGAAAVQAAGDFDGMRRPIIRAEILAGTHPDDILVILSGVFGHQDRQYGIVDTLGRATTFSGANNASWAGGAVGSLAGPTGVADSLVYALQGNILAGECVGFAMEAAIRDTPGDVPAKLMAAMEAAHANGGDGRCSCGEADPTGCGCPPASFVKSGHIGYMIVARRGDVDDPDCGVSGCADGSYCLNFNVAAQVAADPDPTLQLRDLYDAWRADHVGRPDAILSQVSFRDLGGDWEMDVQLRDWRGEPVATGLASLAVEHEADSAGIASIGPVQEIGDGLFRVGLSPGPGTGTDRYLVTADDGVKSVILMPSPELCLGDPCVCDPANPDNAPPGEASALRVGPGGLVTWEPAPRGLRSNVHRGTLAALHADRGVSGGSCLASELAEPRHVDAQPAPEGRWYLAEGRNGCGDGGVGSGSRGPRVVPPCP